jgi:DNA-binding GntR family transcriptional regulator
MKSDPQLASLAESLSGTDHDSAISTTVGRGSPEAIYEDLRARILSGAIAAGADLVQVKVADQYGVSRGPVREAFRLLQREGLIVSEVNLRARVTELSADEVDHLYALRVVNECLALRVSVPLFCSAELDELDRLVADVAQSTPLGFGAWETQHERFHSLLLVHAGSRLRNSLAHWAEYTERYRRVYVTEGDGGWMLGASEHSLMAQACRDRDVEAAVSLLAQHLCRAGLTLIAMIDPSHEPRLLRASLQQVSQRALDLTS